MVAGQQAGRRAARMWALIPAAALLLGACTEREVILPGQREDVRAIFDGAAAAELPRDANDSALPLSLPGQRVNAAWTQRHGTPATRTDHPALSAAPSLRWSAAIGAGDSRKARITADPVVGGGLIFTLDAAAQVTATTTSGQTAWSRSLVPALDRSGDASGGGLAYADGTLYVASGFGRLSALDAASGAVKWQQRLEATGSGNPTVSGGRVYLVSGDDTAWALNADNGRIEWQLPATPDINNVLGGPAPALGERYAVFAFGSGEILAAFRQGGLPSWSANIAGKRRGFARATISDITGDPVIWGDSVYVGSHSGRFHALDLASGESRWSAEEGALSPAWVAGGSVFFISDRNELLRLDARDGSRIWGTELPFFVKERPRKQSEVFAHYGPVLAGGRLVVASNDGLIRLFDPVSGRLAGSVAVPGGATTNPVVAGGTLYVVGARGQLHAFR